MELGWDRGLSIVPVVLVLCLCHDYLRFLGWLLFLLSFGSRVWASSAWFW